MHSHSELTSQSMSDILQSAGEVPPPPMSYNEYVERRLHASNREAYARGFDRGCRHQIVVLLFGMIFGCLLGFYVAVAQ